MTNSLAFQIFMAERSCHSLTMPVSCMLGFELQHASLSPSLTPRLIAQELEEPLDLPSFPAMTRETRPGGRGAKTYTFSAIPQGCSC